MLALAGTGVVWGLLPFVILVFVCLRYGMKRNARDLGIVEELTLWSDEIRVERRDPDGRVRRWQADPWHVRLRLYENGPPEQYLTLKGAGREIELGAFLSPDERVALASELEAAIARAIRGDRSAPAG